LPSPGALAPQCIVTSVDSLGRKCAHALKQALELQHEVFHTKRERTPSVSLYFFDALKVEAEISGENRPVLPLPGASQWFHVTIDLRFIEKNAWRVNHVSIGLLHGDISSTHKKPMLRAEWQSHEKADKSGHAQPHWHVLGAIGIQEPEPPKFEEIVEASSSTQFEAFLRESPLEAEKDDGYAHFHYAMVTDWHVTPSHGPSHTMDSEASLISWLEGCVRYIRHQLDHVARKSGKHVLSATG